MFDKCRLGGFTICYLSVAGSPTATLFRLQTNQSRPLVTVELVLITPKGANA
jgi:hypothetical protein